MDDIRKNRLNIYAQGMADISISRNPLKKKVFVVFRDKDYDQYLDARTIPVARYCKDAVVKKNPDLAYVADSFDILAEDITDDLPWIVTMTVTGFPHNPNHEDVIVIDGTNYVIARVKPVNRDLPTLISCLVYPDRDKPYDDLAVYRVSFRQRLNPMTVPEARGSICCMDVIYGGLPTEMSFDCKKWQPFQMMSMQSVPFNLKNLYIKDDKDHVLSFDVDTQKHVVYNGSTL